MPSFIKTEFHSDGDYLLYQGKFVARFKHKNGPFTKAKLIKALCKYYTISDYFARLKDEAPFGILLQDRVVEYSSTTRKFEWFRI
jgi:hypothetical protein